MQKRCDLRIVFVLLSVAILTLSGCGGGGGGNGSFEPLSLSISPAALPDGTVGIFYQQQVEMTASGGKPPYVYNCYVNGDYGPRGNVKEAGSDICTIDQTPALHGSYNLSFSVTDSAGIKAYADPITIHVNPSADPLNNWNWRSSLSQGNDLYGVTHADDIFVAVGSGILTSPDGVEWISVDSVTTNNLRAVTYGNGLFVGVGEDGAIVTSDDGITWVNRISGTTSNLYGVTYGGNTFVAVGSDSSVLTSSDGTHWTIETPSNPADFRGVTYGNDLFVAVGYGGTMLTSSDGMTWTARDSGTTDDLTGVTYGNGLFAAVTWGLCPCGDRCGSVPCGKVLTSSDGVQWTVRLADVAPFSAVTYGAGVFVAVGIPVNFQYTIFTSYDDILWSSRPVETLNVDISKRNFLGVTYGDGTFVAVGRGGEIIQSDSVQQSH